MKLRKPLATNIRSSSAYGPRPSFEYKPGLWTLPFHYGEDFPAPSGTPVYATHEGVVEKASWDNTAYDGGNEIKIVLGQVTSWYLHLSGYAVKAGQTVKAGQLIGYVGSTGASTGPHLHYELHLGGNAVDPNPYLFHGKAIDSKWLPESKPLGKKITLTDNWYVYRTAADAKVRHAKYGPTPAGEYLISHTHDGVPHLTKLDGSAVGWVHPSVLGKVPEPAKPKPAEQRITLDTSWFIYTNAADAELMRNWSYDAMIPAGTYKITHWSGKTPHVATLGGSPLGWLNSMVLG